MIRLSLLAAMTGAWMGLGLATGAVAGPSHADHEAPLDVRPNEDENRQLAEAAHGLCIETHARTATFRRCLDQGQIERINPREVGVAYVGTVRLDRLAERLKALGETAGHDYAIRALAMRTDLRAVADAVMQQKGFSNRVPVGEMERTREAGLKRLPQLSRLASARKWEEAELGIYEILDDLQRNAIWVTAGTVKYFGPFKSLKSRIDKEVKQQRRKKALDHLARIRRRQTPDFDGLLARMDKATDEVRNRGFATWYGRTLDGPALVTAVGEQWKRVQLDALRTCALDWAWGLSTTKAQSPELAAMLARHGEFTEQMMASFASLIKIDAARTPPGGAAALYRQYLQALAPLVALVPKNELAVAVQPALDGLAARSPELTKEVAAYRAATTQLLQWRRRTAEAHARARSAAYRRLELRYADAVRSRPDWKGLLPVTGMSAQGTHLLGSAASVMQSASNDLVGAKVRIANLVGSVSNRAVASSRYEFRTVAHTHAIDWDRLALEIAALRKELWAEGDSVPLSLEAAVAVATADRGDFAAAGGEITEVYLEPLIPRFSALTDNAWTCFTLGALPVEPEGLDLVQHVMMRFRVQPEWVQHACYFVELVPGLPESATSVLDASPHDAQEGGSQDDDSQEVDSLDDGGTP